MVWVCDGSHLVLVGLQGEVRGADRERVEQDVIGARHRRECVQVHLPRNGPDETIRTHACVRNRNQLEAGKASP